MWSLFVVCIIHISLPQSEKRGFGVYVVGFQTNSEVDQPSLGGKEWYRCSRRQALHINVVLMLI